MDAIQCESSAGGPMCLVGFPTLEEVPRVSGTHRPRERLPESPLAKLLKHPQEHLALPRLSIRTCVARSRGNDSPSSQASPPPLRGAGSMPISIPESYRVSHSLEGQIMEDLSLDAAAQCLLRTVDEIPRHSLIGDASPSRGFQAQNDCQSMESDAEAHIETLAVVELRNLEAKLSDEDSPMAHVVEAMRFAAEDYERLLLECAILRTRACSDDCVFDMDLDSSCCHYGPAAADLQPWVAAGFDNTAI